MKHINLIIDQFESEGCSEVWARRIQLARKELKILQDRCSTISEPNEVQYLDAKAAYLNMMYQNEILEDLETSSITNEDRVFGYIDDMLLDGKFDECDQFLKIIDIPSCADAMILIVLTATLPAKSKLPYRATLYDKLACFWASKPNVDQLLGGLK